MREEEENVKVIISSIAVIMMMWSDKSNIGRETDDGRSFLVDQVGKIRLNNEK